MKLPNGYGSIRKDARGRRRRPYRAMLPAKYETVDGVTKCVRPTLGYYRTKAEALRALAEWNRDPAYYNARTVTLAEIYKTWITGKEMAATTAENYASSWRNLAPLHELALSQLTADVIERHIDTITAGARLIMHNILHQMLEYAVARGMLARSPMAAVSRPRKGAKIRRTLFTPAEISRLWEYNSDPHAAYLLILLYSGMRAKEPFTVTEDHGDYIIAGSKTKAGRGRIIPIHSMARPLWEIFLTDSQGVTPDTYYLRVLHDKQYICAHTLHDTRYTFISRMAELDVPELVVQKIVGHAHNSITSDLYTIKEAPELCRWVEKLNYADNPADNVRTTGEDE